MSVIHAHYDGKVFVPDEPVNVPEGTAAQILIVPAPRVEDRSPNDNSLQKLLEDLDKLPPSDLPPDFSMQLDHYMYGMPKRG